MDITKNHAKPPPTKNLQQNKVESSKPLARHPYLRDILDDLCSRFVLNCPAEEYSSFERICFQLELAHWFYEDEYRVEDPTLPKYHTKEFVETVFNHCPLLSSYSSQINSILTEWVDYKIKVPVCGAILLTPQLDECLLVRGFGSRSTWGFPKGKINQDEDPTNCCVREVFEEIGFNLSGLINEKDQIEIFSGEQQIRLYIVPHIEKTIKFEPQTKGEICEIAWHEIASLPMAYANKEKDLNKKPNGKKYFMIIPFISKLKRWIKLYKKQMKAHPDQKALIVTESRSPLKKTKGCDHLSQFSPHSKQKHKSLLIVSDELIPSSVDDEHLRNHPFLNFRLDVKPLRSCVK